MTLNLEIWRQKNSQDSGRFATYQLSGITPDMSFLEMLDLLNEQLIKKGEAPVEFDSDCREGICGSCGLVINGQAHGKEMATTTCELYMRHFQDGDTIVIEPWRAKAFPVLRDLCVDRTAFDRIIAAGGYTSAKSGPHPDGNAILISKPVADSAMESATCIGCGACVAACPNASASLFTAAKISQLAVLPQGQVERGRRVFRMVRQMDAEGFGNCTNIGECRAACPKEISIDNIATMKREYAAALLRGDES
ncbi:MAG: succinate dehydrogenase/fumarate reductase iron-sulfur subunit [Oligoflexia bacterium]|nr:succinate dehydrogenase/fumarate reductase iron-sulfur subunit [Oligoflexia bacterium]